MPLRVAKAERFDCRIVFAGKFVEPNCSLVKNIHKRCGQKKLLNLLRPKNSRRKFRRENTVWTNWKFVSSQTLTNSLSSNVTNRKFSGVVVKACFGVLLL